MLPSPTSTDFRFEMGTREPLHSDQALLAALRRFTRRRASRPFRVQDFEAWPGRPCGTSTILVRFGSWRAALARVGVTVRARSYPKEELIAALESAWKSRARRPRRPELRRLTGIAPSTFDRHWGSYRRACELFVQHKNGEITRDALLNPPAAPAHMRPHSSSEANGVPRQGPRRSLSLRMRWAVLKRDRYRCTACGRSPATDPRVELQVDHIVPVSKGGGDEPENLRTLCHACNAGRADELPTSPTSPPEGEVAAEGGG